MADRSIVVALRADVNNLVSGMGRAAQATSQLDTKTTVAAANVEKALARMSAAAQRQAEAAAALMAAESRLVELRARESASADRVAAAEKQVSAAQRQSAQASAALAEARAKAGSSAASIEANAKRLQDAERGVAVADREAAAAERELAAARRAATGGSDVAAAEQRVVAARRQVASATQAVATAERELGAAGGAQRAASGMESLGKSSASASREATGLRGVVEGFGGVANIAGVGAMGLAAGIGYAAKSFMDFDSEMASVRANIGATGAEAAKLGDYVRDAGTKFGFSAGQSAAAADDLAKAGLNASQVMGGGLTSALALAAAGGVSTSDSAETLANTLSMFGQHATTAAQASQMYGHAADLIAAGADKSTASVGSLSQALAQGGGVAHQMGISMEQTVGVLSMFDQHALRGADGGTSLKSMLQRLTPQSKQAAAAMRDVGLDAYDANGKFVGLAAVADQLKNGMKHMSGAQRDAAMQTIFGSDAVRAANILFQEGASGVNKWTAEVNQSGFAAANASKKTDSLKGDLNKLEAQVQSTFIQVGSASSGPLRLLAQGLTSVVAATGPVLSVFGEIADGATKVVSVLASGLAKDFAGAGIVLRTFGDLAGSAFSKVGSAGSSAASALSPLTDAVHSIASAFGFLQTPALGAVSAFVAFRASSALIGDRLDGAAGSVRNFVGGLRDFSQVSGTVVRTADGASQTMGRFGSSIAAIGRDVPAIGRMQQAFVSAAAGAERFPRAAGMASASMTGLKAAGSGLMGMMGGPLGIAVAGVGVGLSMLAAQHQKAAQEAAEQKSREGELAGTLNQSTGAITAATRATAAKQLEDQGMLAMAQKQGISLSTLTDAYLGVPGALGEVDSSLNASQKAFGDHHTRVDKDGVAHRAFSVSIDTLKDKIDKESGAAGRSAAANKRMSDAAKQSGDSANGAKSGVQSLAEAEKAAGDEATTFNQALLNVNNAFLALSGSEIGVQQAITSATEAFSKNGKSVDISTKAGQDNVTALNQVAAGMQTNLANMRKDGAGAQEIATKTSHYRDELRKLGAQAGYTGQALEDYVANGLQAPADSLQMISKESDQAVKALQTVSSKAKSVSGQTLTIKTKGMSGKLVDDLLKIEGARKHANGTITIKADPANIVAMRAALKDMKDVAVSADGKIVNIKGMTNAPQIKSLIESLGISAASVDGKTVTLHTANPLASAKIAELNKLSGVAVSTDGKTVTLNTYDPGALAAIKNINGAAQAARNADGTGATITLTTIERHVMQNIIENSGASGSNNIFALAKKAKGGPTSSPSGGFGNPFAGVAHHADGGVAAYVNGRPYGYQDARDGGKIIGPGNGTSDQVYTTTSNGPALMANGEHVLTEREVSLAGGHAAIYRLRAGIRSGAIRGFASGGATGGVSGGNAWAPNMSDIMQITTSLKVDSSTVSELKSKATDATKALEKAQRDLATARRNAAKAKGPNRQAAINKVTDALERQRKAQEALNKARTAVSAKAGLASLTTGQRFSAAEAQSNQKTTEFLNDVAKIQKRGFAPLALSLLNQGDDDARNAAHDFAKGSLADLKAAGSRLAQSDALAKRRQSMLDHLTGNVNGSLLNTAASDQGKALLAMRGAQNALMFSSSVRASTPAPFDYQKLAHAIVSSQPQPSSTPITVMMDGREVGHGVMPHVMDSAATQAGYGQIFPGFSG